MRTAELIERGLEQEFDKFTVWPQEAETGSAPGGLTDRPGRDELVAKRNGSRTRADLAGADRLFTSAAGEAGSSRRRLALRPALLARYRDLDAPALRLSAVLVRDGAPTQLACDRSRRWSTALRQSRPTTTASR